MRWWVATLALAACQFDSTSGGSGDAGVGESGSTSTSPTTTGTSSTTKTPDDTSGASTDVEATDPPATETTAAPTSSESSSSTGPSVEPFEVGPFDEAVPLEVLNSFSHDDDPTLRGDMLEIYFATWRGGTEEIYRSERGATTDEWEPPDRVAAFDTLDWETTPELSPDGLTIVLATQTPTDEVDLYISTRESVDSLEWSPLEAMDELNTPIGDLGLVYTEDLLTGYFCRRDNPTTDLYRATRSRPDGDFEDIEVAMPFGTEAYECNPWIEPGGTTIVLGSGATLQGRDIQWAALEGDAFGSLETVDIVSTPDPEDDPWLSADGGVIFFTRETLAQQDLYWAQRP